MQLDYNSIVGYGILEPLIPKHKFRHIKTAGRYLLKKISMNRKNIYTALFVAAIVGSALNLINSYDVFMKGEFTNKNTIRIVLTYIIPFCVSLYSSIKATKQRSNLKR
ncbi:MAG: nitrate/nitrite transporter NrtS [Ginsengibacter sp.]